MRPKPASNANLLALPDGTELVGDFRIKRVLGAGGFGITYLADEIALARLVTIKEYFPADFAARGDGVAVSPRTQEAAEDYQWGLERFIEEAQTLARFVHPNIVRVYRYFRANNTGYMVLHFEEGGSFKSWLKGLNRAPRQAELDRILASLLDALTIVHAGNFLHRDIAPDNIIIRKDGSPVLIDFGSARGEIASHSKTVSALVKPGYSPYEQYATTARQQGPWTDIYALGATLYHAISGKRPPDAPSRMVNDEYVAAQQAALSSYRQAFLNAIDKSLALEVTERPQSIAEWRGTLVAPEVKAERSVGRVLGLGLGRKRPSAAAPAEAGAVIDGIPVPERPVDLVPSPPDTAQPKGQLLDFIEALKRRRPARSLSKRPQASPRPSELREKLAALPAVEAPPEAPPARPPEQKAKPPSISKPGPGLDGKPKPAPKPAKRSKSAKSTDGQSAPVRVPRVWRSPPRPRAVGGWRLAPRQWHGLLVKLMIGLGIAGLAAAYQESLPGWESRGANVVSSQALDLTQTAQWVAHRGSVVAVADADQGRSVVSVGGDGTLKIWNAGTGVLVRSITLDDGSATALAVDEGRALTGHAGGAIALWDLNRAEKIGSFQWRQAAIGSLAFTGDDAFAVGSPGGIAMFDIRAPSVPMPLVDGQEDQPGQLMAAARHRALLVAGGQDRLFKLWRTQGGSLARAYREPSGSLSALEISPSGRVVASAGSDGGVRLWSASSSRPQRTLRGHDARITALAIASDDRLVASASIDGRIKLWDVRGGRRTRSFRDAGAPVRALAFSADARRLISGDENGRIRVWNTVPPFRD